MLIVVAYRRRFDAGAKDYWISDSALTAIEFLVVGHFELKRYEGWKKYKTVRGPLTPRSRGSAVISRPISLWDGQPLLQDPLSYC